MGFRLANQFSKKRGQIVVIDLSSRPTRAVHLQRKEDGSSLLNYVLQEAPVYDKSLSRDVLAEHLKNVARSLGAKTKEVILVIGMADAILRNVELPQMPTADMRRILKVNSKGLFQQDLSDFVFDCVTLSASVGHPSAETPGSKRQVTVLAGGVKDQFLSDLQAAAKMAGLVPVQITLSQVSLAEAALMAMPGVFQKEAVALVDLGFTTSTISFLVQGVIVLTRVVESGSEKLSSALAEAFSAPSKVGEERKSGIIQSKLHGVLSPLAAELRAAINFFEHQQNVVVGHGFIAGDLARSNLIIESLRDLGIPCKKLDRPASLTLDLPPEKSAQADNDLPQLAVAIGGAAGWLHPEQTRINLLAEQIEARYVRRRDPMRLGSRAAALLLVLTLLWASSLKLRLARVDAEAKTYESELSSVQKVSTDAAVNLKKLAETERAIGALEQHATNRFLWTLPLSAFQFTSVDNVEFVRLKIEQSVANVPAAAARAGSAKRTNSVETITITILARNFADPTTEEKFIEAIASHPYFKKNLRKVDPVILKNRLPRQVDPLDPTKTFTLFTIECYYPERVLGYE